MNNEDKARKNEWQRQYRLRNAEACAATSRKTADRWRFAHPEKHKENGRLYRLSNLDKYAEYQRKRRAIEKRQTPKWADLAAIKAFYKNCPKELGVDHIIPLRGKIVSGLHVLSNLQYLAFEDNQRKGTKFTPIVEVFPRKGEL